MVVLGRALCIALAVHVPHDLLAGRPRVAALAAPVRPDGLRRAARVPATVQQPVLKLSALPALVLTVNENHSKSYQDPGW